MYPISFKAKTTHGLFQVSIHDDIGVKYDPLEGLLKKKLGSIINVGGTKYCVQVNAPLEGTIANLMRLESGSNCSLDSVLVKGQKTKEMAYLAITLSKEFFPNILQYKLQDSAKFECIFPDGKSYFMNMTLFELAFEQTAYYESRYGARLLNPNDQETYKASLDNFDNPSKKPDYFTFINDSIQVELAILYSKTSTWKEFFSEIKRVYKERRCQYVAPWLKYALLCIFHDFKIEGQTWIFDIDENQIISYKKLQEGGKKTRNNKKNMI